MARITQRPSSLSRSYHSLVTFALLVLVALAVAGCSCIEELPPVGQEILGRSPAYDLDIRNDLDAALTILPGGADDGERLVLSPGQSTSLALTVERLREGNTVRQRVVETAHVTTEPDGHAKIRLCADLAAGATLCPRRQSCDLILDLRDESWLEPGEPIPSPRVCVESCVGDEHDVFADGPGIECPQ